jgi:LuxR family transcriptional regulator, positive regulator of biofilm formation
MSNSLQTGLLASIVSEKMKIPCQHIHGMNCETNQDQLLLVDCHGIEFNDLRELVANVHNQNPNETVALLNVEYHNDHESLLNWPCVKGLFFTDTDQEQLTRGLDSLLKGEYWVPRRLLHLFLERNRRAPVVWQTDINLTKRERQILRLIKEGATNQDIADALKVSEHTIKSHLYNTYKKIGVRNRLEASNWVRDLEDL